MPYANSIRIDGAELTKVEIDMDQHGDKTVHLYGTTKDGFGIHGIRYPTGSATLGLEKGATIDAPYAYRAPTAEEWSAAKSIAFDSNRKAWFNWDALFVSTARDAGRGKAPFWEDDEQREGLLH